VNTIRNKLRPHQPQPPKPSGKTQRVRWQDQLRPSSALKISSSKNLRRSSLNKGKSQPLEGSCGDLEFLQQSVAARSPLGLKSVPRREKEVVGEEDF
jgi:hypothetical protein